MKKGDWEHIVAYFDLKTDDGFLIRGLKIVKGVHGMFAGFPSKAGKNGEYFDNVTASRELRDELTKEALLVYNTDVQEAFDNIPSAFEDDKKTEEMF